MVICPGCLTNAHTTECLYCWIVQKVKRGSISSCSITKRIFIITWQLWKMPSPNARNDPLFSLALINGCDYGVDTFRWACIISGNGEGRNCWLYDEDGADCILQPNQGISQHFPKRKKGVSFYIVPVNMHYWIPQTGNFWPYTVDIRKDDWWRRIDRSVDCCEKKFWKVAQKRNRSPSYGDVRLVCLRMFEASKSNETSTGLWQIWLSGILKRVERQGWVYLVSLLTMQVRRGSRMNKFYYQISGVLFNRSSHPKVLNWKSGTTMSRARHSAEQ